MKSERFFFFFFSLCHVSVGPVLLLLQVASERGSYQTFIRCCREPFFLDSHKQPWWHTDSYCLSFFLWAENGQRRERRSGDAFTVFLWPLPDCTYCCQAGWKGKGPTAERGCRPNQPPTQDWYWCTVIHQVYTFDKSWPLSGFKETQIRRQKWQMRSNWPCETWSWQMVLGHH